MSLGRVSVPVWLINLSDQLKISGLVSSYLTNYLILRKLISYRTWPLPIYGYVEGRFLRITHPFAAHFKSALDLHVLGLSQAFILGRDHTLAFYPFVSQSCQYLKGFIFSFLPSTCKPVFKRTFKGNLSLLIIIQIYGPFSWFRLS